MKKLVIVFVTLAIALNLLVANAGAVLACEPAGLTPGYWKNHEDVWGEVNPNKEICKLFDTDEVPYPDSDVANEVAHFTLMDAVQGFPDAKMTGKKSDLQKDVQAAQILLRAAVAAYLNARNIPGMGNDIAYPMGAKQIKWATALALNGDEIDMVAVNTGDKILIDEPTLREHMLALKDVFDKYNNLEL